jgi:hypothetical protein
MPPRLELDVRSPTFLSSLRLELRANWTVSMIKFLFRSVKFGYYDDFNITLEPLRLTSAGANQQVVDLTSIRCLIMPHKLLSCALQLFRYHVANGLGLE